MERGFKAEIAGIGAEFRGGGAFPEKIRARYRRFLCAGRPACSFSLGVKIKREEPAVPVITAGEIIRLRRGDFDCLYDPHTRRGRLEIYPGIQSFDSFLRTFYSRLLLNEGGMMLHSAGLVKNDKAYLFLGKSGAGKSTLSKLASSRASTPPRFYASTPPHIQIISDELNLLRYEKGKFVVYGSPFWGEMRNEGRQGRWPLGGIYILKKAKLNRVSEAAPGDALAVLLRCLMNFSKAPEAAALALNGAARLLAAIPFSRLEFTKRDCGFLKLIGR
jgi:hypothetical protein